MKRYLFDSNGANNEHLDVIADFNGNIPVVTAIIGMKLTGDPC